MPNKYRNKKLKLSKLKYKVIQNKPKIKYPPTKRKRKLLLKGKIAQIKRLNVYSVIISGRSPVPFETLRARLRTRISLASALWREKCKIELFNEVEGSIICGSICIKRLNERPNQEMLNIMRSYYPLRRRNNQPRVFVIVAPEATFEGGALGATTSYGTPSDYIIVIWLTLSGLNYPNLLAHEIGHALFNRRFAQPPGHSIDPNNLMYPTVPRIGNPTITDPQCEMARGSRLLI